MAERLLIIDVRVVYFDINNLLNNTMEVGIDYLF